MEGSSKIERKPDSCGILTRREVLKCGLRVGLAGMASSVWVSGCRGKKRGKRPNIILITVDTLRPDHMSCYGYLRNTSPNIDVFANDSMLFENCLSHAPETRFSFSSILTGFLPHETGIFENVQLSGQVETLSEKLQQAGYKTAAVIGNYVLRRKWGWSQGFGVYNDNMTDRERVRKWPEKVATHTTNESIALLKKFCKELFFMWIHYQDPHGPYTPPEYFGNMFVNPNQKPRNLEAKVKSDNSLLSLSGRGGIPSYQVLGEQRDYYYYVSQYDGEIRYQDEEFGRLLGVLKDLELYDDSLIIFTSDHGEGMGEHDYFFAHGENLHSDQLHVPLVIKYRNELQGRRKEFVQHLDVVPTILKVAGAGENTDSRFRGYDLRQRHESKREIFAEMNSPIVKDGIKFSIIFDGYKLIYTPLTNEYLLFDIKRDPYDEHNIASDADYASEIEELKTRLHRIRQEDFLGIEKTGRQWKRSKEELEKLKSLGYVR